ncbi:hypothetical protein ACKKBG_A10835 [Auxenochlorella protothecoides x Auxenochlorella symbiontica]
MPSVREFSSLKPMITKYFGVYSASKVVEKASTRRLSPKAPTYLRTHYASSGTRACRECISSDDHDQKLTAPSKKDLGTRSAISLLKGYRAFISPLLQPVCRFIPSCSVYSIEAYETYGATKGTVLMVWRILRCTPWGGSGLDPVQWPPPGLERFFR